MTAERKILVGLDPGPAQTAFVIFDGKQIVDHGIWPNEALAHHYLWKQRNIWCEMIASYGMAVGKEVFETCVWIGRFIELAKAASGKELTRIHRKEIKLLLCNSLRAKDANVRQALLDLVGPQGTKREPGPTYGIKSHEWAALAVASVGWNAIFGRSTNVGCPPA